MKRLLYIIINLSFLHISATAQDAGLPGILSAKDDTVKARKLSVYIKYKLPPNHKSAEELTHQLLELSKKLKYDAGMGDALSYFGYFEYNKGNFRESIDFTTDAIQHYQRCRDTLALSKCYGNLAQAYEAVNSNDSGMTYRMKAISLIENTNSSLLALHYLNLGIKFLNRVHNPDKALFFFKKGEEIALRADDTSRLLSAWVEITRVLNDDFEKYDESLIYVKKVIELAGKARDGIILSQIYANYSNILLKKNKLDSAVWAAKTGMQYAETARYPEGVILNGIKIARVLKEKGDYREQKRVLENALETAKQFPHIEHKLFIYKELSEANYRLGNYRTAYDLSLVADRYADSIRNERDTRIFAELETKYQTSLKEKSISQKQLLLAQKDLQLQKNRNYMYYSLAALVMAILVAGMLYVQYRHKKLVHTREIKAIQQQKEIQLLQAVMQGEEKERNRIAKDLHDGVAGMLAAVKMHFSSMPAVDHLLQTEGYQQGMKLLNDATQEIRKTSHNLMPEVLLQHGLDEALRRYCNNVNNSKTLQLQYDSWGEIDRFVDGFELSVYRIVQELINNVIKHSKASQAMVQLTQQGDLLSISIEDNGIGFEKDREAEGMGLRSLQSRIKAMNGKIELLVSAQAGVSAYLEFEVSELKKEITTLYE
ncbi:MAG: sensor histidine kinase [Sphingobacteriales bacterium]|nr:sensor histidine kinase [Sphingobacteriales bacterium]